MKVALASDHGGWTLKQHLGEALAGMGHEILDFGPDSPTACDYPDYAVRVAKAVADGEVAYGILCCGSGIGMSMAANRLPRVRAALCRTASDAELSRRHNNANVLCLGERVTPQAEALALTQTWLSTAFEGGRHQTRIDKIDTTTAAGS